jgi:hypothetical protein
VGCNARMQASSLKGMTGRRGSAFDDGTSLPTRRALFLFVPCPVACPMANQQNACPGEAIAALVLHLGCTLSATEDEISPMGARDADKKRGDFACLAGTSCSLPPRNKRPSFSEAPPNAHSGVIAPSCYPPPMWNFVVGCTPACGLLGPGGTLTRQPAR